MKAMEDQAAGKVLACQRELEEYRLYYIGALVWPLIFG